MFGYPWNGIKIRRFPQIRNSSFLHKSDGIEFHSNPHLKMTKISSNKYKMLHFLIYSNNCCSEESATRKPSKLLSTIRNPSNSRCSSGSQGSGQMEKQDISSF